MITLVPLFILLAQAPQEPAPPKTDPEYSVVNQSRGGMGTRLQILIHTDNPKAAGAAIKAAFAEMDRIEKLMSEWLPKSNVSRINQKAGKGAVPVAPETVEVISKGRAISELSEGAFSMSWASLSDLWRFDVKNPKLPDALKAKERALLVDDTQIEISTEHNTVTLAKPGMTLGLGGIAKGYALNKALEVLKAKGFENALVFAGGDLAASGKKGNQSWLVGIQDPRASGYFATLPLKDEAVATSGDYERYFEMDGTRYHHILDRNTGYPAVGTRSVTIVAKNGLTADAMATAVFVLGPVKGMELIENQPDLEGIIIAADNSIAVSTGLVSRLRILRQPTK